MVRGRASSVPHRFPLGHAGTNHFQAIIAERAARVAEHQERHELASSTNKTNIVAFAKKAGKAVKDNWVLLIYMVVLMTGFNSCSHGSQDFFPTVPKNQVQLDATDVTVISVVRQLGSITGGTMVGFASTYSGRRLIMLITCVMGGALVPTYILPRSMSLVASAFFEQVFVGGVWGPIPLYLMELSPVTLRTTVVGLTYQLGNLASSASATIQAVIGEQYPLSPDPAGEKGFYYGKVIVVFMAAVWGYVFVFLLLGPEMSQEERDEEAEAVRNLDHIRQERICKGPSDKQTAEEERVESIEAV